MTAIAMGASVAAVGQSFLNDPGTLNLFDIDSPTCVCGIRVANDRGLDELNRLSNFNLSDWLQSAGTVADYEVRCVQNSGTAVTGAALNTFLACSTSRDWSISTGSSAGANLTITIRRAAFTSDSVSFTVTLDATVV